MWRIGLSVVLLLAGHTLADARGQRQPVAVPAAEETLGGMGCYWYRQRQYCGRYCYVEENGRRYCREREREAVPQSPPREAIIDLPMWELPMKLGVEPPRARN